MPSDARAAAARREHQLAAGALAQANQHRETRDRLIRQLRAEDPKLWTHARLAAAIGCSPELIAHIMRQNPADQDE